MRADEVLDVGIVPRHRDGELQRVPERFALLIAKPATLALPLSSELIFLEEAL
jgi:hypothetical protein